MSISYQTLLYSLIFIANTCLYVGRWNIEDLKINDNLGSGEKSTCSGANELKKDSGSGVCECVDVHVCGHEYMCGVGGGGMRQRG